MCCGADALRRGLPQLPILKKTVEQKMQQTRFWTFTACVTDTSFAPLTTSCLHPVLSSQRIFISSILFSASQLLSLRFVYLTMKTRRILSNLLRFLTHTSATPGLRLPSSNSASISTHLLPRVIFSTPTTPTALCDKRHQMFSHIIHPQPCTFDHQPATWREACAPSPADTAWCRHVPSNCRKVITFRNVHSGYFCQIPGKGNETNWMPYPTALRSLFSSFCNEGLISL